ncbi:MAG: GIY-YIG nuclease family protein [Candidatus Korobacteraceae bacterium]
MREHRYAVYIMASRSHTFYVGVTNDIERRVREHKSHTLEGFTSRYNIDRLVWYEIRGDIRVAIAREKQIKRWRREKKIRLIELLNPTWQDLLEEWGKPILPLPRTADPSARAEALGRDDK